MAYTMVQGISKLSLKMGVLLRGSVYEQKKCVRSPSVFITLGTYPRFRCIIILGIADSFLKWNQGDVQSETENLN